MNIKNIIPDSVLCIISTFSGQESIEKAKRFIAFNRDVMSEFSVINLVFNSSEDAEMHLCKDFIQVYKDEFKSINCIYRLSNDGHMFGTLDLDEMCLWYAKSSGKKYLWKSTEDVIMRKELLDVDISEGKSFYYVPGFSYETLQLAGSINNLHKHYEDFYFAPQTNFFIVETASLDKLYGFDVQAKKEAYSYQKEKYPGLKPWDMKFPDGIKFGLEDLLGSECKSLTKECLLSEAGFKDLCQHVLLHKESDPSHKNIYLYKIGVCHYHHYKENVYIL